MEQEQSLARFFKSAQLRDILDTVGVVAPAFESLSEPHLAERWRGHVAGVFAEENVAYRLGDNDIVHPYVDQEFEGNRASALACTGCRSVWRSARRFRSGVPPPSQRRRQAGHSHDVSCRRGRRQGA